MDFVDNLFVSNVDEVVVDDLEESNSCCGDDHWHSFRKHFDVEGDPFNLLVEEDYHDPCVYGGNVDEELDLDVDGDNDKKIKHHFKNLDLKELENLKASGCWCNIHSKIWVANAFNA